MTDFLILDIPLLHHISTSDPLSILIFKRPIYPHRICPLIFMIMPLISDQFVFGCELGDISFIDCLLFDHHEELYHTFMDGIVTSIVHGHVDILRLILSYMNGLLILGRELPIIACQNNNLEMVKWMDDNQMFNQINLNGVFITMCKHGYLEIAKFLLDKHPEINIMSGCGAVFRSKNKETIMWLESLI